MIKVWIWKVFSGKVDQLIRALLHLVENELWFLPRYYDVEILECSAHAHSLPDLLQLGATLHAHSFRIQHLIGSKVESF